VEQLLSHAVATGRPVYITAVNWAEVLYIVRRREGQAGVNKVLEFGGNLPIDIVAVDAELAAIASEFKAAGRLSLADAFAAALAKQKKAGLVTGDPEFKTVEGAVKIHWLGTERTTDEK
jgi:ribonuclease VapC